MVALGKCSLHHIIIIFRQLDAYDIAAIKGIRRNEGHLTTEYALAKVRTISKGTAFDGREIIGQDQYFRIDTGKSFFTDHRGTSREPEIRTTHTDDRLVTRKTAINILIAAKDDDFDNILISNVIKQLSRNDKCGSFLPFNPQILVLFCVPQYKQMINGALSGDNREGLILPGRDATLDSNTRDTHRQLDGQIRETDELFVVDTKKAMQSGGFGDPAEDCNCRCVSLTRARWGLDEKELETLKERVEFFEIDKSNSFKEH